MRGSGKTTVGRLVARALAMEFVDLDNEVERCAGERIAEIVARHGWERFRDLESEAVRTVLARDNLVVATGGGITRREENVRVLKSRGMVVWLDADTATLFRRTAGDPARPPLTDRDPQDEVCTVALERAPGYAAAADLKLDSQHRPPDVIAGDIVARLRPGVGP
jgi:shikimate kinase